MSVLFSFFFEGGRKLKVEVPQDMQPFNLAQLNDLS